MEWESCGEPAGLVLGEVESFLDEFREDGRRGAIGEKMGQGVAQGAGDDGFGGDDAGPNGAQPGAEGRPYELGDGGGQGEQDALGNESELDEAVVGGEFPSDGVAVLGGLAV